MVNGREQFLPVNWSQLSLS